MDNIKLTQFSHGGGCGCKISPAVLTELLAKIPIGPLPKALLVGTETSDDAAVYQLNDTQAIIATTDFFTPIVDNPFDFGRIAATNALSDIYAMGGTPIMALALVGMPLDKLPQDAIADILAGGANICHQAGIPITGGHSIDILEPIYGLVGIGIIDPKQLKSNAAAQIDDVLLLTKPLGIGMLSAALKKGQLSDSDYHQLIKWTTTLNKVGIEMSTLDGVHAMTDVTGFGIAGHLLEMCRAAKCQAEICFSQLPLLDSAVSFAKQGIATGASNRNWKSYGEFITLDSKLSLWQRNLLTDPQTSGGLLISCAETALPQLQNTIKRLQGNEAAIIGKITQPSDFGYICVKN